MNQTAYSYPVSELLSEANYPTKLLATTNETNLLPLASSDNNLVARNEQPTPTLKMLFWTNSYLSGK
jgi:hypothetical protein